MKTKIFYLITLNDDRWYFPKYRWWFHTNEKQGSHHNNQKVYTMKKVIKVLRRLKYEGYKGNVIVNRRLKYIPGDGHVFEEFVYTL
jgi:hypothetical protein